MKNVIEALSHWELLEIEKPARYLGGEVNQVAAKESPALRTCLVFPDLYELGMSNLALKIFYESLNQRPDIVAERAFSPWPDFEGLLRRRNLPLYGLLPGADTYFGLTRKGRTYLYVSPGLGGNDGLYPLPFFRLFNPPTVSLISLTTSSL